VAWFTAHAAALRRITRRLSRDLPPPPVRVPEGLSTPDRRALLLDIAALFRRDLANVEAGVYPMPRGDFGPPLAFLDLSRRFLEDVPKVVRRRAEGGHQEVLSQAGEAARGLPRYYRQNFHFQTDGWLSAESAALYDFQVEVLFSGATSAMRRQGLVRLGEIVRATDQRRLAFADIACGTGGFLLSALEAFPRLPATGVDLSAAYIGHARDRVRRRDARRTRFVSAAAEALPFADASHDVLSAVFLFHELPPKVRRAAAAEFARVLRPGGRLIFIDSLQTGDRPEFDGLLAVFPQMMHEPYYGSYLEEDLDGLFAERGLVQESFDTAFLSRVVTYRRDDR